MDLEVAGADRRLDAVAVAARLGERLRDRRLAGAEEAQHAARRAAARARAARWTGSRLERARPQRAAAPAAGPGSTTTTRPPRVEHEAGRGAGEAERERALRQRRLLASRRPRSPRTAARSRSATAARSRSISRSSSASTRSAEPGARGEQLDRAVVVRRPEPARDDAEVGLRAPRAAPPRAPPGVADDRDPCRLEPERERARAPRNGPFRSVRSPRTSSLPVTTIAARGARSRDVSGRRPSASGDAASR